MGNFSNKKSSLIWELFLYKNYLKNYFLEDFLEVEEVDFLAVEALLAEDLQEDLEELHFLLLQDLLLLLICSTAIDQKYSSWPIGQPAFCQIK